MDHSSQVAGHLCLALGLTVLLSPQAPAIDLDADGLSDIWQQKYGAQALSPLDDTDRDGTTNGVEAEGGTDPFDAGDHPLLEILTAGPGSDPTLFTFPTTAGTSYQLNESTDLTTFGPVGPAFPGSGENAVLSLSPSQGSTLATGVVQELWADVTGTELTSLTGLPAFPGTPDGTTRTAGFEAPPVLPTGFGGRLMADITPAQSGDFTFSLSAAGPAELLLNGSKIAEVLSSQTDIPAGNFALYPEQRSAATSLVAGTSYTLEIRYLATVPRGHCQAAWSGPGLSGDEILSSAALVAPVFADSGFTPAASRHFFRLGLSAPDQDGDGLSDWEEMALAAHQPFLFFDATTTEGTPDANAAAALLAGATGTIEVSLAASDTAAFESNAPFPDPDHGEITLTRTGPLTPVTINLCQLPLADTGNTATICDGTCCTLVGSAGDEEAEAGDYTVTDSEGNLITNTVTFGLGEMSKVLTLTAIPDTEYEYPETVNLAIEADDAGSYQISPTLNGASIQVFDLPDHPDNNLLFTGTFSQDGNAVAASSGSGYTTAILNGPRTGLLLWNEFSNLTSAQQDSHIHKANPGPAPGDIIYAITNVPGAESGTEPDSDPLNGPLAEYPWDITASSGAVPTAGGSASKQTIIDSLCNQNGESPLYLNIHTVDNPAGEIWAFLILTEGSVGGPGAPAAAAAPGSAEYPLLAGDPLASEVRRFLNQATFGATDSEVAGLIAAIETERLTDPSYHRHEAFEAWLDDQMNTTLTPQTYLVDFNIAIDWQHFKLAGMFDPVLNPDNGGNTTPTEPSSWPTVDRSNPDPALWHLSLPYPVSSNDISLASSNGVNRPDNDNRRYTHWQAMLTAKDQLRQKMGFALQQIVVVSAQSSTLRNNTYGCSNYQDLLNHHAFHHYRDVLGFVNWSPIMGKWLSSLQNQKAFDVDGDQLPDIFPDENLARENMQLFSIGLFELWPDGSLRLGANGLPIPTYNNDDIREFAKIITGQSFSRRNSNSQGWGGAPYASIPENTSFFGGQNPSILLTQNYIYPMKMFGQYHDTSVKTFAGTTIDNTGLLADPQNPTPAELDAMGVADIEEAIDWLAGKPGDGLPDYDMTNSHRSTPAFISLRLIQRFVTSNPSRDYLHRVATVFKDNEGDLGLTLKAVLLDPEARVPDLADKTFGNKKSPLEGFVQLVRALNAYTLIPLENPNGAYPYDTAAGDFSNPALYLDYYGYPAAQLANHSANYRTLYNVTFTSGTESLQMSPFRQETVFNWYLTDYAPGGPVADSGLVAPEMQLANEPDIIRNINYFETISRTTNGISLQSLAGTTANQRAAFNSDSAVDNHDQEQKSGIPAWTPPEL